MKNKKRLMNPPDLNKTAMRDSYISNYLRLSKAGIGTTEKILVYCEGVRNYEKNKSTEC